MFQEDHFHRRRGDCEPGGGEIHKDAIVVFISEMLSVNQGSKGGTGKKGTDGSIIKQVKYMGLGCERRAGGGQEGSLVYCLGN